MTHTAIIIFLSSSKEESVIYDSSRIVSSTANQMMATSELHCYKGSSEVRCSLFEDEGFPWSSGLGDYLKREFRLRILNPIKLKSVISIRYYKSDFKEAIRDILSWIYIDTVLIDQKVFRSKRGKIGLKFCRKLTEFDPCLRWTPLCSASKNLGLFWN